MKIPKISIIIPCYKVEKLINRCLKTVVSQSLKDIEIILVDDKSPDNTPNLCDEWAKKDSRILVIHKEKNEGLGYARNAGLEVANGEYIAFIDSDDYIDTDMYKILYESATTEKIYDAVLCGLRKEIESNLYLNIKDYDKPTIFTKPQMGCLALSFLEKTELNTNNRLFMSVWHGIYKRELIENINLRFYSERDILSEDLPFQISFFSNASIVKFIPDVLYTYCLNSNSLSNSFDIKKFETAENLKRLLYELLPKTNKSKLYVDLEYYGRVRYLLIRLLLAKNISVMHKYKFIKNLCNRDLWNKIDVSLGYKIYTWKYMKQYKLLKTQKPLSLIVFVLFDKYVNKKNLKRMFNLNIKG